MTVEDTSGVSHFALLSDWSSEPIDWLFSDPVFTFRLHTSISCSNDRIGMLETIVPIPGVLIFGLTGFGIVGLIIRKTAE